MGIEGNVIVRRHVKNKSRQLTIDVLVGLCSRTDTVEERNGKRITLKVPRMWSEGPVVTDTKAAWEV